MPSPMTVSPVTNRSSTGVAILVTVVLAIAAGSYLYYVNKQIHSARTASATSVHSPTPAPVGTNPNGVQVGGALMLPSRDIVENVSLANNLTIFVKAIQIAELTTTLKSAGPFTLFVPTDKAFNSLPQGSIDTLFEKIENKPKLADILTYHMVPRKLQLSDLKDGETLTTVEGKKLSVDVLSTGAVTINGSKIETANVPASNGTIFVIDTVLVPAS